MIKRPNLKPTLLATACNEVVRIETSKGLKIQREKMTAEFMKTKEAIQTSAALDLLDSMTEQLEAQEKAKTE